jgi:hypothetical protein
VTPSKTVLTILALLLLTVVPPLVGQGDYEMTRKTLAGLKSICVLLERSGNVGEDDGLDTTQIRTDVELKLRQAGIVVLSPEQSSSRGLSAFLYVNILAFQREGVYAFYVDLTILQRVRLIREPSVAVPGGTWSGQSYLGTVGRDGFADFVRSSVRDRTDEFINAYLAANPKRGNQH